MREKKLGRWVVRLACAIGVGVAVLGGAAVVNAAEVTPVTGKITPVDSPVTGGNGKAGPIYSTDDIVWA
jgi:hypothetical protein